MSEVTRANSIVWQYPNTVEVVVETLQVVNPSSGCSLYLHIHRPANAGPGHPVPGVAFVPGGTGFGSEFVVIGGEWFAMWQSPTWNGQQAAFRFYVTILLVVIFVAVRDDELADRSDG